MSTEEMPEGSAPRGRRSTGFKLAVGCAVLAGAATLVVVIGIIAGLSFLGSKADGLRTAFSDQAEIAQRMETIERTHAFRAPEGGAIQPDRFARFSALTEEVWAEVRHEAAVMEMLAERAESGRAGASLRAGLGGLQGMGRIRVAVGEAFDRHDMPPSEYAWIAGAYLRAIHPARESGHTAEPPEANIQLASNLRNRLEALGEESEEAVPVILFIAATLGTIEDGLDVWMGDLERSRPDRR